MTTADRIDPVRYRAWTAPVVVHDGPYIGRHRQPGRMSFSLRRMCYAARHISRRR